MKPVSSKIPSNSKPWSLSQYYKYLIMTKATRYVDESKRDSWNQPSEIMKEVVSEN